ncbi:MAG: gamma-glutamyl-gamma-aminobutyrate hydrolase family protein [Clostridiales bacterium]|nr:gamma-glutamyl-gamma-aminobutyrate hydrolase family protein [Clostridiales bacterium]
MKPIIGVTPQYNMENRQVKVESVYFQSIRDAGGVPILLPLHNDSKELGDLLSRLDGVLFTGGPDVNPSYFDEEAIPECGAIVPERDELEINLVRMCMERKLPILGICRGIQVLNIALGGDIYQDLGAQFQKNQELRIAHSQKSERATKTHKVKIEYGTLLSRILNKEEIWVNSFHHQSVRKIADGVTVAATSSDGLTEAITMEDYPFFLGVQWHPEEMYETDKNAQKLFNEFIIAASVKNQI